MEFTIDELEVPTGLDGDAGADFAAMVEVRNLVEADAIGSTDLAFSASELLQVWQDQRNQPRRALVARADGRIVARAVFEIDPDPGADAAMIEIGVLPEFRRHGIGSALYERLLAWSREADRAVVEAFSLYRPHATGAQLTAPTGYGSVPSSSPATRFLRHRGFTLEQVERMSRLRLPVDTAPLDALLDGAHATLGEYRVLTWHGRTPAEHVPGMARLHRRLSVDAPTSGVSFAELEWDESRIAEQDDAGERSPRTLLVAAAEHVPTRTLVGFTELSLPAQTDRAVDQGDTLVLREHRGHRLGLLLKIANLKFLQQEFPGHPAIVTFHAEENRYMLAVNETIGFEPVAYEAAWRRPINV